MPSNPPSAIRWTRDEYYKMAEAGLFDGRRVELIRGEVIEMAPQESPHATGVTLSDDALRGLFGSEFSVRIQLPLSLGYDSDPEPDAAVVPGPPRAYKDAHPTSAVLVVEVADTSLEYDRNEKAGLYAEAGIEEYWIVNLTDRQLEVYREPRRERNGYAYARKLVLTLEDSVSPLALAGASLRVSELFP